jgi:hypothetical protein
MTTARLNDSATLLQDGRVLIAGGGQNNLALAELYDPKTGTFKSTGSMTTPRSAGTATLLEDGRVLVAGGFKGSAFASAELYDPKTGSFALTGSMATPRGSHTATRLSDGRVLIVGGSNSDSGLASAELYDPNTGAFSPTGSMTTARLNNTATLLQDGRVLIAGGTDSLYATRTFASAELYDPKTGAFSPTGSMGAARSGQTATLLQDGRVLIAGGSSFSGGVFSTLASAELYDPNTGAFSPTGSMTTARSPFFYAEDTATLLQDGQALIAGGSDGANKSIASAELYDPKTGAFSPTGPMTAARANHTATLLSDGRVLIAGGNDGSADLASAELYQP